MTKSRRQLANLPACILALLLACIMAACTTTPAPRTTDDAMSDDAMSDDAMSSEDTTTADASAINVSDQQMAKPMSPASILMPIADDPTVTFSIWFQVGSQDDPEGKEGLAALTGEMISNGATTEHSFEQILKLLYPIAASYNVRVDKEMTTITGRTHVDNVDRFFDLFSNAYLRPAFDVKDFERLKSQQLNSIEKTLRFSSDEELAKAALIDSVFAGTGYAHPVAGTVDGINSLEVDDVRAFYQRHYTAGGAVFALGGGYADDVVARFTDTRQQLPTGADIPSPALEVADIEGRQVTLVDKPGADASISFGFPIDVHRGDADYYALWLANSWLGEHRNSSSHLYGVIREKRGLNYGDYSYIEAFPEGGRRQMPPTNVARRQQMFEVWIRTLPNEQALFALRAAIRELDMLIDQGMSRQDFELTRSFLSKYHLHYAPTTRERLGYRIDDAFYGVDGEGHLANFATAMDALTLEGVNAAIRRHLQTDDMKIAMVTGDAAGLRAAMAADSASPIEYPTPKSDAILEEDEVISTYLLGIEGTAIGSVPVDEVFGN